MSVRDSNGTELKDGDSVLVIKDVPEEGLTEKSGQYAPPACMVPLAPIDNS